MMRSLAFCAILMTALLPGCVGIGGTTNNNRPTAGQELIDLKAALNNGAITQAEYDQKKQQILATR